MFYLTGRVGRASHKGSFAAGDERVSIQVLDMGQNVWIGAGATDSDIMTALLELRRGDSVSIPCEISVGKQGTLYISPTGKPEVSGRAQQTPTKATA